MSKLPPDVEELLAHARGSDEPSTRDHERVRASLMATLTAGGGGDPGSASNTARGAEAASDTTGQAAGTAGTAASGGLAAKWTAVVLLAALGGSVALFARWKGDEPATPPAAPAVAPRPSHAVAPPAPKRASHPALATPSGPEGRQSELGTERLALEAPQRPARTAAARPEPVTRRERPAARKAKRRRARDGSRFARGPTQQPTGATAAAPRPAETTTALSKPEQPADDVLDDAIEERPDETQRSELELIRRATHALKRGELLAALASLREHQRRFPRGALAEERDALQVLALCRNGRTAQGLASRARFLTRYPSAPMAARVRAACTDEGSQ